VLFQSFGFAAFLAAVVAAHGLAPARFRRYVLLAGSYVFYATWSLPHTVLLAGLTLLAHRAALALDSDRDERTKGRVVTATILALVATLALFKYAAPFVAWWRGRVMGGDAAGAPFEIVAPLGISYYIFKLVSYVLDVHWGKQPAQKGVIDLASYVSFFPHILSGPIQRAGDFFQQGAGTKAASLEQIQSGLRLILFGFFQKFVVADRLGAGVDAAFSDVHAATSGQLLAAIYVFPWQLYADFAGLTEIAIGLGRLFVVEAPPNFNAPFYAADIVEFWRRWHMTLTSWITSYVFTPLNLKLRDWGRFGLATAIFVNMVTIGLWHGASGTFLVFGALNGAFLVAATLTAKTRNKFFARHPLLLRARRWTGPILTFHFIAFACILFRASSLAEAREVFVRALPVYLHPRQLLEGVRLSWKGVSQFGLALGALAVMEAVYALRRRGHLPAWLEARPLWLRWTAYYAAILVVVLCGVYSTKTFIYVQF
jgi:D-alanyl-lipoteichoic acid acyltransferase DltB (MBOAT superfamily)